MSSPSPPHQPQQPEANPIPHSSAEDKFENIRRWPSDLRRYIAWSSSTKSTYGTSEDYILKELLHWDSPSIPNPSDSSAAYPFARPTDYKILLTEWPYGLEPGMKHMIVWMKNRLETDPVTGRITLAARAAVDDFVERTFRASVRDLPDGGAEEKIQWGKSWGKLMTVPGVEHFHVFVRNVPDEVIMRWITGEERRDR